MAEAKACGDVEYCPPAERVSIDVDDVQFAQPVGFVWFTKPRYRIKAGRKVTDG